MGGLTWRPLALFVASLSPLALLAWLLATPSANGPWADAFEHFAITSNVAILMFFVAVLIARAAIQAHHYPTLLIALGFASLAGIFAVHGLSTPGVLQRGDRAGDANLVVGVSAQLSLWIAGAFFAIRYTPLVPWIERRVSARRLVVAVLAAVGAYALVGLAWPAALGGLARWMLVSAGSYDRYDPSGYGYGGQQAPDPLGGAGAIPYLLAASNVVLLGFAAYRQGGDWLRTRLPMQGALAISFLLLAQAQVSQFLGPTWTPSWWE